MSIKLPEHSILILTTGAVILGVELTASRYMSPMFGSSLYIWGAILSVTLICLSGGYSIGGRMGERLAQPINRLVLFVLLSAAWIGVLPLLQSPVARLGMMSGQILGPLVVTTLLFAPPLLLLATATPMVFAQVTKTAQGNHATTMGDLFAISTVGSVLGALATAYGLIPLLGLRHTLFALSVILVLPAIPHILRGVHLRTAANVVFIIALAQLVYETVPRQGVNPEFRIIHSESSLYGELSVLAHEQDGSRILLLDGTTQNWVGGETFENSLFEYTEVIYAQLSQYNMSNRHALVLGLGAGTIPRTLNDQGYSVETVEIDPAVYHLARQYFGFPDQLPVYLQDARVFLQNAIDQGKEYGVIVVDIAIGGSQPAHLFSREAVGLMRELLAEDGVLATNQLVVMAKPHHRVVDHYLATLDEHFQHNRAFNCYPDEPPEMLTNFITLSSSSLPENPQFRSRISEALYTGEVSDLRPITDNWNPTGLWSVEINKQWHRNISSWLGYGAVIPL